MRRAVQVITNYATQRALPLASVLLRLDGLYGDAAPLLDVLAAGLGVIARSRAYHFLDLEMVKQVLVHAPSQVSTHPESGMSRALYDCTPVSLTPAGPEVRLVVATRGRYSSKAMTTWGDSEDYRYFLPRLLELFTLDPGSSSVDSETICRKLEYAQWAKWPQEERQAIIDYLLAFWQLILTHESYALRYSAGEYLEALSQALEDLSPFLWVWRRSEKATALRALADFVKENGDELGASHTLKWLLGSPATQRQVIACQCDSDKKYHVRYNY